MKLFGIIEPYITGITSILGIFFIQAVWLTVARFILGNRFSEKKLGYIMDFGSVLLMTLTSIYLTFMSATDNYYYLYGNLRLVIILIPAIFISVRVSIFSIICASIFRLFYFGISSVTVSYIVIFTSFLLVIIVAKKITNKNNFKTLIASFIGALPIWFIVYMYNFDGTHIYSIEFIVQDYSNFVIISSITYLSGTYLYYLNSLFFKTITDSLTDELTKARNLKDFNLTYSDSFDEAKAKEKSLILALFDIDHFKSVNDTYGHLAGNYVLVELTKLLKEMESLHYGNMLFRTGGEEFALLFSGISDSDAFLILEEVRKNVENHLFFYEGEKIDITISIGMASYLTTDSDRNDLYNRADEALYRSKKLGRNQVSQ